jgi:YHS domain-containing protein
MKKLLFAAVLGVMSVAVQAADPEFNKECVMGLAMKKHVPTDCSVTWTADNGKVYCFSSEAARTEFLKAPAVNIAGAETFWSP